MGVEDRQGESPGALSMRAKVLLGVIIGALFAVGMGLQGDALPGIVAGVLAAVLVVLVLRDVERQRAARRRGR